MVEKKMRRVVMVSVFQEASEFFKRVCVCGCSDKDQDLADVPHEEYSLFSLHTGGGIM